MLVQGGRMVGNLKQIETLPLVVSPEKVHHKNDVRRKKEKRIRDRDCDWPKLNLEGLNYGHTNSGLHCGINHRAVWHLVFRLI
jgi:hypothetical protein